MGPREALEKIRALIADAMAAHDIETVRSLLREMQNVTERAIGTGTLRRSRLTRARSGNWHKAS
jgi:hypothetical protein